MLVVFSNTIGKLFQISLDLSLCSISTPESSQTDSDDFSPQMNRRRKTGYSQDAMPKFSISVEDGYSTPEKALFSENPEISSLTKLQSGSLPLVKHKSRSVVKSASASGLSLMIPSGKNLFKNPSFF